MFEWLASLCGPTKDLYTLMPAKWICFRRRNAEPSSRTKFPDPLRSKQRDQQRDS